MLTKEEYTIFRYKICYQITGCLRVLLDWFLDAMPLPVDKFVYMVNTFALPGETLYRNIPNIVVRINEPPPKKNTGQNRPFDRIARNYGRPARAEIFMLKMCRNKAWSILRRQI
jgi:hypothetical protein